MEEELSKLNWENRFDTFITYWKEIGEFKLYVSRHINESKWTATLVQWDEEPYSNEININYDTNFKWLMDMVQLLSIAQHERE